MFRLLNWIFEELDYEFLKILSVKVAEEMSLPKDCDINLLVNIRSAHIVP